MRHSVKNDLLIGFIVSALLSLFVNFSMLMRKYDVINIQRNPALPEPPVFLNDYLFYFPLVWFFLFAFFLFIVNMQMYKLGDKIFRQREYKVALFAGGGSVMVGLGLLAVFPMVQKAVFEVAEVSSVHETVIVESRPDKIIPGYGRPISKATKNMEMRPDRPDANILLSRSIAFHPQMTEHLFVLITVLLSVLLIRLISGKQQMMLEYEKLKTEQLQTSYNALMGQINPHFFFNSLNGLNSLIRNGEKEHTLTYLDELSNVFRYILQSNKKEMVALAEELQFVKAYTYLLGVRYEGKLFFSIQAEPRLLLWSLPILSVLPLIENAVKHNVISKQYPLQIDIYTTKENTLVVSNKVHPKVEEGHSSGIGLKNLWGRYRLLTGKDINISNRKEYFKVSLPLSDLSV